jgi:S1-C subfamily serine protease
VNALDVVVAALVVAAVYGGWRLGMLVRLASWGGMALGALVALRLGRPVTEALRDASPETRLVAVLVLFVTLTSAGQSIGVWAGASLRRGVGYGPLAIGDRVAGGFLGGVGILAAVWLLAPTFASARGWPEDAVGGSFLVQTVERVTPEPPDALVAFDDLFEPGTFPRVFDSPVAEPGPPPPETGITAEVHARVVASTVLVLGEACDRVQHGSGFVAADGLVVTNAHVVAGERETTVETADGRTLDATVVAFDPSADLAALSVPGLSLPPLAGGQPEDGAVGAVYGHPGGGGLEASPARVSERIRGRVPDIYRDGDSTRDMLVLAAELAPGDSGAAVVGVDGTVLGIAFAIDPDSDAVAYAFEFDEVASLLASAASGTPVTTGRCLG